jgi:hypothetical protein
VGGPVLTCIGGDSSYSMPGNSPTNGIPIINLNLSTLTLETGDLIYDFSGNNREFVNWSTSITLTNIGAANKAYSFSNNAGLTDTYIDFFDLDTNINNGDDMERITWVPSNPSYGIAQGLGGYQSGISVAGNIALRGGASYSSIDAGIYSLDLSKNGTLWDLRTSFVVFFVLNV